MCSSVEAKIRAAQSFATRSPRPAETLLRQEGNLNPARHQLRGRVEVAAVPRHRSTDDDARRCAHHHVTGVVPVDVQTRHRDVRCDEISGYAGAVAEMLL